MSISTNKSMKWLEYLKQGFRDIGTVLQEANYKLFLKQLAAVVVLFIVFRWANEALINKQNNVIGQIDAVHAQQNNENEYLSNKTKLLELEPRFPDASVKNDWLLRQIVAVFKDSNLLPKVGSSQAEDASNAAYIVAAIPVDLETSYDNFAHLIADIENRDDFLRVTEFSIDKNKEQLGQNSVKLRISTVFVKEKIAPIMFKNTAKKQAGDKK